MIFDDLTRSDLGPSTWSASNYRFLNESARPAAVRARQVMQTWADNYPSSHKIELIQRLKSDNDLTHQGAFFELLLHELFRLHSSNIEIEPVVSTGKRPDFLVTLNSGESLYVEATLVSESLENTGPKGAINRLIDIVNQINSHDYFVDIEVEAPLAGYPSARDVLRSIEQWHNSLVYEDVVTAGEQGRISIYELRQNVAGGVIVLSPIPKQQRGAPGRFVGSGPSEAGWSDISSKVRKGIIKKANKYGLLDNPLLVAVNVFSMFPERDDIIDALFGSEAVEVAFNDTMRDMRVIRQTDGVWTGSPCPRYKRLSGILWTSGLVPWNIGGRTLELVTNPWANKPLPELEFQLPTVQYTAKGFSPVDGLPLTTLLGLPLGWPLDGN